MSYINLVFKLDYLVFLIVSNELSLPSLLSLLFILSLAL